jgi:hypothetical protein
MGFSHKIHEYLEPVIPEKYSLKYKFSFDNVLRFKKVNPGEQTTGTFHKLVLDDISTWYNGTFYKP